MAYRIVLVSTLISVGSCVVFKTSEGDNPLTSNLEGANMIQPKSCMADNIAPRHATTMKGDCPEDFDAYVERLRAPKPYNGSMISLSTCPIFYQTATDYEGQTDLRKRNIESAMAADKNIKVFNVVYWRRNGEWQRVRDAFAKLRLSVCYYQANVCNSPMFPGQFSRYMTLLMALAYQIKNDMPCMIMLEDDVDVVRHNALRNIKQIQIPRDEPYLLKLGAWGEGYIFNRQAIDRFVRLLYKRGLTSTHDWFLNQVVPNEQVNVNISLGVGTNGGDIMKNTYDVNEKTFAYDASHDPNHFAALVDAFQGKDDLDFSAVLRRFLQQGADAKASVSWPEWSAEDDKQLSGEPMKRRDAIMPPSP